MLIITLFAMIENPSVFLYMKALFTYEIVKNLFNQHIASSSVSYFHFY